MELGLLGSSEVQGHGTDPFPSRSKDLCGYIFPLNGIRLYCQSSLEEVDPWARG